MKHFSFLCFLIPFFGFAQQKQLKFDSSSINLQKLHEQVESSKAALDSMDKAFYQQMKAREMERFQKRK